MNIVFVSRPFAPRIGGIETHSKILAEFLHTSGHSVTVLTDSTDNPDAPTNLPFSVVRQPSNSDLITHFNRADVIIHAQLTLRALAPWLIRRKPLIIIHHTWLQPLEITRQRLASIVKRLACRFATNITCSKALGLALHGLPHQVIPNPYDDTCFHLRPHIPRDKDLIYVGRLVSDKGIDLLISSLGRLHPLRIRPNLTIVGFGPEEQPLRDLAAQLGIADQVHFAGILKGDALAECLNQHRTLVVPSRWDEPFGIVALEGLASGCTVIASNRGGLPEAAGPEAFLFSPDHPDSLDAAITQALSLPPSPNHSPAVATHLAHHTINHVGNQFESAIKCAATLP